MSNAILIDFLKPERKRRIFKLFNIIVLISLIINIPLGIAGAGVFFITTEAKATGEETECIEPVCGNGIIEEGEECDDGNLVDGDGCSSICLNECLEPVCGNGVLEEGEECDDGNTEDGDGCSSACLNECIEPVCGNGILEEGEECDDGNTEDGDGCDAHCQNECIEPICGNGMVEEGEECDDGNTENGDGCDSHCRNECVEPVCGNGVIEEGEECDDGNAMDGDGCDAHCQNECVEEGTLIVKKLVIGGQATSSDWTMHIGDAISFPGSASGTVSSLDAGMYQVTESGGPDNYELNYSGDCGEEGHVTIAINETKECVLTNTFIEEATSSIEICKYIDSDGLASTTLDQELATSSSWTFVLDNGVSTSTQNTIEGCALFESLEKGTYNIKEVIPSGWSLIEPADNVITYELGIGEDITFNFVNTEIEIEPVCGDGIINQEEEECDDGPDGSETCTSDCKVISTPEPRCGDGILDDGEQCDDGNTVNNDGCSSTCARESGGGGGGGLIRTNRGGSVVSDTPIVPSGDPLLNIEKSVLEDFANAGDKDIKYRIVIANNSNFTALNLSVVDNLPAGFTYSGTEISTKIWNVGDLEGGKFATLDFLVDIDYNTVAGKYENTATVSADNHDSISDTAMLEVRTVEVAGVEKLVETGFSVSEIVYLLVSLLALFGVSGLVRKRAALSV